MKQFESVFTRGLVVGALCLTAGIAQPGRGEETTHGTGKAAAETGAFGVAPDSRGTIVPGTPAEPSNDSFLGGGSKSGRAALGQPACTICLTGAASATWNGSSGSFHVDRVVNNRGSGSSGPLDLKMVLIASLPVWGQTIYANAFSATMSLNPLAAGYMYAPVDSGTISYYGGSMPVGEYFLLMYLREYVSGTWYYEDWIQMDKKVSCNGSGCFTVNPPSSCVEDAYTMCLVGGRYRVTSYWRNQYAGGAMATLSKAKLTDATGAFWIANASTYEYLIRFNTVTNNGRIWVAIPTFTDVEFWVDVADTVGGQTKEYHSLPGNQTLIYDPYFFIYP